MTNHPIAIDNEGREVFVGQGIGGCPVDPMATRQAAMAI